MHSSHNLTSSKTIRPASIEDIPGIIAILEQNLMTHKTADPSTLEKCGFLLHGFTPAEAKVAILDKSNFIYLVLGELISP